MNVKVLIATLALSIKSTAAYAQKVKGSDTVRPLAHK